MLEGAYTSPAGQKASLKNISVLYVMEIDLATVISGIIASRADVPSASLHVPMATGINNIRIFQNVFYIIS